MRRGSKEKQCNINRRHSLVTRQKVGWAGGLRTIWISQHLSLRSCVAFLPCCKPQTSAKTITVDSGITLRGSRDINWSSAFCRSVSLFYLLPCPFLPFWVLQSNPSSSLSELPRSWCSCVGKHLTCKARRVLQMRSWILYQNSIICSFQYLVVAGGLVLWENRRGFVGVIYELMPALPLCWASAECRSRSWEQEKRQIACGVWKPDGQAGRTGPWLV